MKSKSNLTIEYIKRLGKEKNPENIITLKELFKKDDLEIVIRREIVSSIGRQKDLDAILEFDTSLVDCERTPMELIYQVFRTCLYKSKDDSRFESLRKLILEKYNNEIINRMNWFYEHKDVRGKKRKESPHRIVKNPLLLIGDTEQTSKSLPDESIGLVFTSPPYYNARQYSDYHSYQEYLLSIKKVFKCCHRVLENGRFMIVNISPVITKRPGREFESIRYPIHFDFHKILTECGFYFVDEIIWIKPEASVVNRNGGFEQSHQPLSYKPNCITESILVYRKDSPYLLDENINIYEKDSIKDFQKIETSNCWYISPKSTKDHPAVFPEELCRRIVNLYSFKNDAVMDPFAGSGTLGRVAHELGRIPVMCELNEQYAKIIEKDGFYDIRRNNDTKHN